MNLIIHVGLPKTGTTSIQQSLWQMRDSLAEWGIYYPTIMNENSHRLIGLLLGMKPRWINGNVDAIMERIKSDVDGIRKRLSWLSPEYLLLSSEYFNALDSWQFDRIMAMLEQDFESVKVIVYIREPVAMYLSTAQQLLKASHVLPDPVKYLDSTGDSLKAWEKLVGKNNIIVRLFSHEKLVDGDIVSDFESVLREQVKSGFPQLPKMRMNASLSAETTVAIQRYRRFCCSDKDNVFLPSSDKLLSIFTFLENKTNINFTKCKISPFISSLIVKNNKDMINYIDDLYPDVGFLNSCPDGYEKVDSGNCIKPGDITEFSQIIDSYSEDIVQQIIMLSLDYSIKEGLFLQNKLNEYQQ